GPSPLPEAALLFHHRRLHHFLQPCVQQPRQHLPRNAQEGDPSVVVGEAAVAFLMRRDQRRLAPFLRVAFLLPALPHQEPHKPRRCNPPHLIASGRMPSAPAALWLFSPRMAFFTSPSVGGRSRCWNLTRAPKAAGAGSAARPCFTFRTAWKCLVKASAMYF